MRKKRSKKKRSSAVLICVLIHLLCLIHMANVGNESDDLRSAVSRVLDLLSRSSARGDTEQRPELITGGSIRHDENDDPPPLPPPLGLSGEAVSSQQPPPRRRPPAGRSGSITRPSRGGESSTGQWSSQAGPSSAQVDDDDDDDIGVAGATSRAVVALRTMREGLKGWIKGGRMKRRNEVSALYNKRACMEERYSHPQPAVWKHSFMCLAYKDQSRSPLTISEKEELSQAGLGDAVMNFDDLDMSREKFKSLLISQFPKLADAGGYHFLKCLPNSRKLEVLPPIVQNSPIELKKRVGCSKTYIRPIQRNLDLSPVKQDIDIDEPSEECLNCHKLFPLSTLEDHLMLCNSNAMYTSMSDDSSIESESVKSKRSKEMLYEDYDPVFDSVIVDEVNKLYDTGSSSLSASDDCNNGELQSIIRSLRQSYVGTLIVEIRRDCLLKDALREATKSKFSTKKEIKARFSLEPAIDQGGPKREFFRLFALAASETYFIGDKGYRFFSNNVKAIQDKELMACGQYCAISIIQGGNGFPFFAKEVYKYITTACITDITVEVDKIPNGLLKLTTEKLHSVKSDEELKSVFEDDEAADLLYATGYRKPLALTDALSIERMLLDYHLLLKVKTEMDEFISGLEESGLLSFIKSSPKLFEGMFMANLDSDLSADDFKDMLKVENFAAGPLRKLASKAWIHFSDFLDMCEENAIDCLVRDVLAFTTGSTSLPPLGFDKPLRVDFLFTEDRHPTASTCDLTLRIPTAHDTKEEFIDAFLFAMKGDHGFGEV